MKVGEKHKFLIKNPSTFFSLNIVFSQPLYSYIWQEMIFVPEKTAELTAKNFFQPI